MINFFSFIINDGLFYKETTFVAEFCPRVIAKFSRFNDTTDCAFAERFSPEASSSQQAKGKQASVDKSGHLYQVVVTKCDGTETKPVYIGNLHRIPFFELFGCLCAGLTDSQLDLLELKLQLEATNLSNTLLVSEQGLHYYTDQVFLVWGQHVISSGDLGCHVSVENDFTISVEAEADRSHLLNMAQEFINFMPGVTEPLWYAALAGAMKPIYSALGYDIEFVTALIGPSGYLKTSMVKLYALWGNTPGTQFSTFRSTKRVNNIITSIDGQIGQNYLLDDIHEAYTPNSKAKLKEWLDIIVRHVGEVENCANIFVTSESSKNLGIFSSKDRLLQIYVRPEACEPLLVLKPKINKLSRNKPVTIVYGFLQAVMYNFSAVERDIIHFFEDDSIIFDSDLDQDTRIDHHGLVLRLTKLIFRKYFCGGSSSISGKEGLEAALRQNASIQREELKDLKDAERPIDYTQLLYEIVHEQPDYYHFFKAEDYNPLANAGYTAMKHYMLTTRTALALAFQKKTRRVINMNDAVKEFNMLGLLDHDKRASTKKYMGIRHLFFIIDLIDAHCSTNCKKTF